jgi:predicted esterase
MQFDPSRVVAVILERRQPARCSLLGLECSAASLLRAMVPIVWINARDSGHSVLVSSGRVDPLVPVAETERLVALLHAAGADVTLQWQPAGHQLVPGDIAEARAWLQTLALTS